MFSIYIYYNPEVLSVKKIVRALNYVFLYIITNVSQILWRYWSLTGVWLMVHLSITLCTQVTKNILSLEIGTYWNSDG